MPPDFLAGQPPRPSTPVPGLWLLDAPPVLHVRVYTSDFLPSSSSSLLPPDALLERVRDDPLERAWLAFNAAEGGADSASTSVLLQPACVVRPASDSGDSTRELWVFSPDETDAISDLGLLLTEKQPRPPPITLSETVTCAEHGAALSCLEPPSDASKACSPVFTPPESWKYLEAAAGEKLAWQLGTRLALLPSEVGLGEPLFDVLLRPTPGRLLLSARARPALYCAPGSPRAQVEPFFLRPLGLPALLVSPHTTTTAQDARLSAAFDTALGSGWRTGRAETRIAMQAAGERASDWSVYFVPLQAGAVEQALPRAVSARWRGTRGVLTVWPTHLARPLSPAPKLAHPKPPAPGPGLGAPPDILATAAGLFDFLSSYTAPAEEEEEEEEVEGPSLADIPDVAMGDVEPDGEADGDGEGEGDGGADAERDGDDDSVADLFSAHSSEDMGRADGEAEGVEAEADLFPSSAFPSPGKGDIESLDVDDLFEEVAELPEAPKMEAAARPPTQLSSRAVSPHFSITEDDFNFFDSPAPPIDSSPAFEKADIEMMESVPEEAGEDVHVHDEELFKVEDEGAARGPAEPSEEVEVVAVESPERPLKRQLSLAELVPEAFAPLPLERRSRPRFEYGLPSPAATVSSIRAELVERLRQSNSDGKYNYAADWDVESDSSEAETHSELTTGAPPTPTSTASMDERTPARQPSVAPPPDNEVEYDGTLCVGSEWTTLRGEAAAAAALARAWGPAWADQPTPAFPPSPMSPPRPREDPLACLDVEALANAVVRNRLFRTLFDHAEDAELPRPLGQLISSGVALSDLAPVPVAKTEDEEAEPRASYTLSQATVNVGFGSTVMRISVAGLRYWRELGLEPAGGPKDVKAFAVCEPGADSERAAAAFLADVSEVYTAHQLGKHEIGDGDDAGVVPSAIPGMAEAVDKALLRDADTVVYVLLSGGRVTPSFLSPFLARRLPPSVHIVPVSTIRVPNLMPLAFEVYDAISRPVERVYLHGKPMPAPPVALPYHAFTLASDVTKPELSMSWPQRSYDVLNRWRLVHGAYAFIPALHLLLVSAVDAQGDACEVKAIKLDPGHTWAERVERAWDVFSAFAGVAATEWRLSIASHGLMSADELAAWRDLLGSKKDPVTLLMADIPPPRTGAHARPPVSNIPPSAFANSAACIVDETLVGGAAVFAHRLTVDLAPSTSAATSPSSPASSPSPSTTDTIYPATSFLVSLASQSGISSSTTLFHTVFHRPAPNGEKDKDTPLAPEMHRLACLARRRYALDAPLHLGAVGAAARAMIVLAGSVGISAGIGAGAPGPVEIAEDVEEEVEVEAEAKASSVKAGSEAADGDGGKEEAEGDKKGKEGVEKEEADGEKKSEEKDGAVVVDGGDGAERKRSASAASSVESIAVPLAKVTASATATTSASAAAAAAVAV